MTVTTARADLSVVKARQQKTWASGDFAVVASRIVLASELLADAADLRAGWKVLDVACGNGNAVSIPLVHRWLDTTAGAKGRSWGRHQARSGQ